VEKVSRDDVARHVGVNGAYLSECFREETGVTFTKYLNRYRVNRAKELLAAGEKSVTEVAMEVGFSSGAYFSRVFRRETGLSPSVYRRGDAID
jgi:two-component system response regulator YesN